MESIDEALLPVNPSRLAVLGRGLGFPYKNKKVIRDIRAYGIRPWGSEPVHNGIDIIVDNTGEILDVGDKVTVVSVVDGTVSAVIPIGDAGYVLVAIAVNPGLFVAYMFEPQTENVDLQILQRNSIIVSVGQRVKKGQKIGYLIVGEGENGGQAFGSGNPHIDMRLLLVDPETIDPDRPIEDLIDMYISHNDVAQLPTFLCPYDYSSVKAKSVYEKILKKFDPDIQCKCACRFPYNANECGIGCID
jgi:hypothetical protein